MRLPSCWRRHSGTLKAAEAVARVRRDYTSGDLTAAEWRELSADLNADHEAALAKLAQLEARAAAVAAAQGEVDDAEGEAVRRLAEIRAAVAGEVSSARDLDAVRAALSRMFESFTIGRPVVASLDDLPPVERALVERQNEAVERVLAAEGAVALDVGRWTIVAWARPEVVAGIDETWQPILRREPLTLANDASMFGPIFAMARTPMREAAERIATGIKVCSLCREPGPLRNFNRDPHSLDGHRPECGECQRAAAREGYRRRTEGIAADLRPEARNAAQQP